jgi:FtsH-binding integral membrane protein
MAGNQISSLDITSDQKTAEQKQKDDEHVTVWTFLWVLLAFKIATIIAIIWASRSWEAGAIVSATSWPFLIIPAVALAGPVIYRVRVRRVRARRAELMRSEWMLDS